MTKLVVEVVLGEKAPGTYYAFSVPEILVGRGFKNDLIISDPYVSEHHLRIVWNEDEIRIIDLASKNGTYVPALKHAACEVVVESGDELILGTTSIRLFRDSHQVSAAHALRRSAPGIMWMRQPWVAWVLVGLLFGNGLLAAYLVTDTKIVFARLLVTPIVTLLGALLWSGAWAFVGRLTRQEIRFSIHLALICLFLILVRSLENVAEYIGYYTNSPIIYIILACANWAGLFLLLLHASFGVASNMREKTKWVVSATFSGLCLMVFISLYAAFMAGFYSDTPSSKTLKPPIVGPPPGISIDAFMRQANRVFEFDRTVSGKNRP